MVVNDAITIDVNGCPASLPIVADYKHVGISVGERNSCAPDVARKSAQMLSLSRAYGTHVTRNSRLPVALRASLAESLILTASEYGSGTLPILTARQLSLYHRSIVTIARDVINEPRWKRIPGSTDAASLVKAGFVSPHFRLKVQRIRTLSQLLSRECWQLLALCASTEHCKTSCFSPYARIFVGSL